MPKSADMESGSLISADDSVSRILEARKMSCAVNSLPLPVWCGGEGGWISTFLYE